MKRINLTGLFLLSILVSSCDFWGKEIGRCDLTEAQQKLFPYEEGQVISFIDNTETSIDFTVTDSKFKWNQGRPADEAYDYYTYRVKSVKLKSSQSNINFQLIVNGFNCCDRDYCELEVYPCRFSFASSMEGNFLNDTFDSIEINNKVYYDVVEGIYHSISNFPSSPDVVTQLFYNKTYGILQIKRDGADYLTLNP
jgi:hypothetical protein